MLSCRKKDDSAAPLLSGSATANGIDVSSGIDLSKQAGTRYQVTYASDVVHVSAPAMRRDLIGVNRDHDIYVFSDTPELRSKLAPGRVVLFEGVSFKKILAVATDGSHLIVGTEQAPLTRLFKDADIRWHTPINFLEIHNRQVQALSRRNSAHASYLSPPWLARPVYAAEAKEEDEEGWHIKSDADFSPDKVNFQVDLKRNGDLLDANITG
jgi:hypothetical protein